MILSFWLLPETGDEPVACLGQWWWDDQDLAACNQTVIGVVFWLGVETPLLFIFPEIALLQHHILFMVFRKNETRAPLFFISYLVVDKERCMNIPNKQRD